MYNDVSNSTNALLDKLYANIPDYEVNFASVQQQQDSTSCGRWAIAYAFDLALGNDPATTNYDEAYMADHLLLCFDQGCVMAFPGIRPIPMTEKNITCEKKKSIKSDFTYKEITTENDDICKGCGASVKQLMKHLAKKITC